MKSVSTGENTWCSPSVLSILTGKTTDECARVYSIVTGRREISEVYFFELKKALDYMRYEYKEVASDCSLYSLFIQISRTPGFYIVEVPRHVVAVEVDSNNKVWFCDNHTKEPINGAASARLGQRAVKVLKVTPKPDPIFKYSELEIVKSPSPLTQWITIWITNWDIYESEEDNQRREIGTLRVKDEYEFIALVDKLSEKLSKLK